MYLENPTHVLGMGGAISWEVYLPEQARRDAADRRRSAL